MSNAAWISINLDSKQAPMNVNTNVSLETEINSIWQKSLVFWGESNSAQKASFIFYALPSQGLD